MKNLFAPETKAWVQAIAAAAFGVGEYAGPNDLYINDLTIGVFVTHGPGLTFSLSCDRLGADYTVKDYDGNIVTYDEERGIFTFTDDADDVVKVLDLDGNEIGGGDEGDDDAEDASKLAD